MAWTRREALIGLGALSVAGCRRPEPRDVAAPAARPARPNVVVVLVDDLRADSLGFMGHPVAQTPAIDALARDGMVFDHAFVVVSICSPSRGTLFTGTYPHHSGVYRNRGRDPDPRVPLFVEHLQRAGYTTAHFGKWHMAHSDEPRRGFDRWVSFRGQGDYVDPTLNRDGVRGKETGYVTDLLTDTAVRFIEEHDGTKPFFMSVAHKSVHGPLIPPARYRERFADAALPRPVSWDDDLATKPAYLRAERVWGQHRSDWDMAKAAGKTIPDRVAPERWPPSGRVVRKYRDYLGCLLATDDSVGRIRAALDAKGLAQNTLVIVTSDNGMMVGEHGVVGAKQLAYEESIRIPFVAYWPSQIAAGSRSSEMVTLVDVAPTLLALADASPLPVQHGLDLQEWMCGTPSRSVLRDHLYYEHFGDPRWPGRPDIQAVRSATHKLIRSPDSGFLELYDVRNDPAEMVNLAQDAAAAPVRDGLLALLDKDKAFYEASRLPGTQDEPEGEIGLEDEEP